MGVIITVTPNNRVLEAGAGTINFPWAGLMGGWVGRYKSRQVTRTYSTNNPYVIAPVTDRMLEQTASSQVPLDFLQICQPTVYILIHEN